jgi:hypothetical protein
MEREPVRELWKSSCRKSPFCFLRNRLLRASGHAGRQESGPALRSAALRSAAFSARGFISYRIRVNFGLALNPGFGFVG